MRFLLKTALLLLLVVGALAFLGGRYRGVRSALETDLAAAVKLELAGEYASATIDEGDKNLLDKARGLLNITEIELVSLRFRERGDGGVARAEVRVAGGDPPDGRRVRYFRLRRSGAGGWSVAEDARRLDWWRAMY